MLQANLRSRPSDRTLWLSRYPSDHVLWGENSNRSESRQAQLHPASANNDDPRGGPSSPSPRITSMRGCPSCRVPGVPSLEFLKLSVSFPRNFLFFLKICSKRAKCLLGSESRRKRMRRSFRSCLRMMTKKSKSFRSSYLRHSGDARGWRKVRIRSVIDQLLSHRTEDRFYDAILLLRWPMLI